MKRIGVVALPLFLLAALITPGLLLAANEDSQGEAGKDPKPDAAKPQTKAASNSDPGEPIARFEVKANPVALEDEVKFDASESSDADGDITEYAWDLNGNRTYEADGGDDPTITNSYSEPGEYKVRLRVTDPNGERAVAKLRLIVVDKGASGDEGAGAARVELQDAGKAGSGDSGDTGKSDGGGSEPNAKSPAGGGGEAKAAASRSVTIKDFSYAPKTVTVKVGDTVTWKNDGPSGHTATAMDGSFDTGILNKGETGSHTFNSAGTVEYICTPHPFMKATVKVSNGSGGSGSGGSSSEDSTLSDGSGSGSGSSSDDGSGLPTTGAELATFAAVGLGLLMLGLMLRSAAAPSAAGLPGTGPIGTLGGRMRGATLSPRRLLRREQASHPEPPERPPESDGMRLVAAIRSAARADGGDLRSIVGELFAEPPTADIQRLRAGGATAESFHAAEIAPNWDGLDRSRRAAKIERFLELQGVFAQSDDMPAAVAETAAAVNTKVVLLAWAYDQSYGYVARLLNGSGPAG